VYGSRTIYFRNLWHLIPKFCTRGMSHRLYVYVSRTTCLGHERFILVTCTLWGQLWHRSRHTRAWPASTSATILGIWCCVCVCVWVCEREREREGERDSKRERKCVRVCVCVREREREREKERERGREICMSVSLSLVFGKLWNTDYIWVTSYVCIAYIYDARTM